MIDFLRLWMEPKSSHRHKRDDFTEISKHDIQSKNTLNKLHIGLNITVLLIGDTDVARINSNPDEVPHYYILRICRTGRDRPSKDALR